jgi:hypothetical protein
MLLRRQWPPELMWRHAQRANQFGAAANAVAAGNKAAYRRQSVTQVSTSHTVRCILAQGRPVPRCTPLQMSRHPQSATQVHTRHSSIQVQVVPIHNSLTKAVIALLTEYDDYADAMFNLALLLQRQNQYSEAADYWRRYLANDCQSEWAARARRSLKFCEMQINLIASA